MIPSCTTKQRVRSLGVSWPIKPKEAIMLKLLEKMIGEELGFITT